MSTAGGGCTQRSRSVISVEVSASKNLIGKVEEGGGGGIVVDHGSSHGNAGAHRGRGNVEERPCVGAVCNRKSNGAVEGVGGPGRNVRHVELFARHVDADRSEGRDRGAQVSVAVGEGDAGIAQPVAGVGRDVAAGARTIDCGGAGPLAVAVMVAVVRG